MKVRKFLASAKGRVVAGALLASAVATNAMAAGIDISADTTAAKGDIQTNGGYVIGVVVAVATISWIRRIIK